jgi:hypothetical protein
MAPISRHTLLFLLANFALGCGGERLVPVSGTATCNGKPVPNLVINFVPDSGPKSYAVTDQAGRFEMVCGNGQRGVVAGSHKVWVRLNLLGSKEDPELRKRQAALRAEPAMMRMLEKYGNVEKTPLAFAIDDAKEFELKLD